VTSVTTIRPTRTPPLALGMVLFLTSELMLFGSLFAAYFFLRSITPVWPPEGVDLEVISPSVATVILTASSFTLLFGLRGLEGGNLARYRGLVLWTFVLGAAFLAIKAYELSAASFRVSSHAYGSLWFTMLSFHALHLAVGMVLLLVMLYRGAPPSSETRPTGFQTAQAIGYYWHFVDVVWIAIYTTLFLVR
jgi:heme/copper-type cytochrome/quinol oxidase subunit 3